METSARMSKATPSRPLGDARAHDVHESFALGSGGPSVQARARVGRGSGAVHLRRMGAAAARRTSRAGVRQTRRTESEAAA